MLFLLVELRPFKMPGVAVLTTTEQMGPRTLTAAVTTIMHYHRSAIYIHTRQGPFEGQLYVYG